MIQMRIMLRGPTWKRAMAGPVTTSESRKPYRASPSLRRKVGLGLYRHDHMNRSPTQETIDGNAKPPHRKWPAAVLVAGTVQLGITSAKLSPTKKTLRSILAISNLLGFAAFMSSNVEASDGWPCRDSRTAETTPGQPFARPKSWVRCSLVLVDNNAWVQLRRRTPNDPLGSQLLLFTHQKQVCRT